jgi:3-hydroxymyristoyl/3-hydroxydecanoyl-(acyl carrier protein) dehydratase
MPISVLTEVVLQPCGWLASYMGFMREDGLLFRNLDGMSVNVLAEVTRETGLLTLEVVHIRNAVAGPMTLVFYDVVCRAGATIVMTLSAGFGFFLPEALKDQKGLPMPPQRRAAIEAASDTRFPLADGRPWVGRSGAHLPSKSLLMVDEVTGFWPDGGRCGLGRIRGRQAIAPGAWYFKAHFFQDPVQPGSLGLEALMQLARVAISLKDLDATLHSPDFEIPAVGRPYQWKFRGQIGPGNVEVITEVDIVAVEPDANGLLVTIDGSVWVDGLRIYEMTGAGIRLRTAAKRNSGRKHFSRRLALQLPVRFEVRALCGCLVSSAPE